MRSYLPIFLLVGAVLILSLIGFVVLNLRSKTTPSSEESVVPVISLPFVALTPDKEGRELALAVSKIDKSASTLEYELVYNTQTGVLQGVPGSINIEGQSLITRKLTLGTCSSGVCRYDKGLKDITLTLRLRDKSGKLLAKFATGVALLSKIRELASTDGRFKLTLDRPAAGFYTVLQTGGLPANPPGKVVLGPYGAFTSGSIKQSAKTNASYIWNGKSWQKVADGKAASLGVFVDLE